MDLTFEPLQDVKLTGAIRLVAVEDAVALYMASSRPEEDPENTIYKSVLAPVAAYDDNSLAVPTLTLRLPLPVEPDWDLALSSGDAGSVAYSSFGGGWNTLEVGSIADGKLSPAYAYNVENTQAPSFVLSTGNGTPKQAYVGALLSGYQLGMIGLADQDGLQVPQVAGIVGTADAPISAGRIWGDLTAGLPVTVNVIYLASKNVGPLAPNGAFCGNLYFATYDTKAGKLGTPVPLLPEVEFCDFDVTVAGDIVCLLGVTGTGAPLVALFDDKGAAVGTPNMPAGIWSNADSWIFSPTIVAMPSNGSDVGFSLAFASMKVGGAAVIYTGTLMPPKG